MSDDTIVPFKQQGVAAQPCCCQRCVRAVKADDLKRRLAKVVELDILPILNEAIEHGLTLDFLVAVNPVTARNMLARLTCTEQH